MNVQGKRAGNVELFVIYIIISVIIMFDINVVVFLNLYYRLDGPVSSHHRIRTNSSSAHVDIVGGIDYLLDTAQVFLAYNNYTFYWYIIIYNNYCYY